MYDEPGSRTRLAWIRTSLAMSGLCALLIRGVMLRHASVIGIGLVIACASALGTIAVLRSTALRPQQAPPLSLTLVAVTAVVVSTLAFLGLAFIAEDMAGP